MRYKAFVSYSHVNRPLAGALQNALHRFGTPWYERRGQQIFRDESGLAASPDLWAVLQSALDQSEFFVYVASPESARSVWVAQEVDYWLAHRDPTHIILALASGTLRWDLQRGAFDADQSDALPGPLLRAFAHEPLHVDFRSISDSQYRLSDARFRDRVASIAATLHGKSKDELYGLQVAALIVSDAERMAAGSQVALGHRLSDRALLLSVNALRLTEAHGEPRVPLAETALRQALTTTGGRPLGVVDGSARPPFGLSGDGRWLCTVHPGGEVHVWDLSVAGTESFAPSAICACRTPPRWVELSHDGSRLVAMKPPTPEDPDVMLEVWRLTASPPVLEPLDLDGPRIAHATVSPDGRYLAISLHGPPRLAVWRLAAVDRARGDAAAAPLEQVLVHDAATQPWPYFAPSGPTLASVEDDEVRVWNLESADPRTSCTVADEGASVSDCRVSPDGRTLLLLVNDTPRIHHLGLGTAQPPIDLTQAHELVHGLDMSPDGRWGLLLSESGPSYLVDLRPAGQERTTIAITSTNGTLNRHAFSRNGHWLVTAAGPMERFPELQVRDPEYLVRLHDLGSPSGPYDLPLDGHEDLVTNVAVSSDGTRLASCSLDRTIRLRDLTELDDLATVRARLLADPLDRDALVRDFEFDADNLDANVDAALRKLHTLFGAALGRLRDRAPQVLLGDDAMMQHCRLSADRTWLVTSGYRPSDQRNCARLWHTSGRSTGAAPMALTSTALVDNFSVNQTIALSPDQRWLVTVEDCSLWRLAPERRAAIVPARLHVTIGESANVVMFSGASDLIAFYVEPSLIVARIEADAIMPARVLDTGGQETRRAFFTGDDRWLVAICGKNVRGEPADVRLWRPHEIDENGTALVLLSDVRALESCTASPAGRWLIAWNSDAGSVWDLRHDDPTAGFLNLSGHSGAVAGTLFTPDERLAITAGADGRLLAWDLDGAQPTIDGRRLFADTAPLECLIGDWDRHRLFVGGSNGRAMILTLDEMFEVVGRQDVEGLSGPVNGLFDPTGRSVAIWDDGGVRLYEATNLAPRAALPNDAGTRLPRPAFMYSPDGRWLIVSRQGRIFLVATAATDDPVTELLGHHHPEIVFRVTRDGQWLVTIDRSIDEPEGYQPTQTCRIWDLQSPDPADSSVTLPDMPRGVDRITITDDDRWLITTSRDGVRLWPLGTDHLIDIGRHSIGREPTDEERRRYAFTAATLQGIE